MNLDPPVINNANNDSALRPPPLYLFSPLLFLYPDPPVLNTANNTAPDAVPEAAGGSPGALEAGVNCPDAAPIPGTVVTYTSDPHVRGSRAFYQCEIGFTGRSRFVQCQTGGLWSSTQGYTGCVPTMSNMGNSGNNQQAPGAAASNNNNNNNNNNMLANFAKMFPQFMATPPPPTTTPAPPPPPQNNNNNGMSGGF
ncbi:hypothetical protein ElyMa_006915400, partial [Elysia marginata]